MSRRSLRAWGIGAALAVAAGAGALAGCSVSAADLGDEVAGKPGVLEIDVREVDVADHDLPFSSVPWQVAVVMAPDATGEEVMAVFDAYGDEIADGDVLTVEVTLDGPRAATLSSGEGGTVARESVEDLVRAQHDPAVVAYRREGGPAWSEVLVRLAPTDFATVVARADDYRDGPGLDAVSVESGDFVLVRDRVNDEPLATAAREELVRALARRFTVRGATVTGRGPLRVVVVPEQRAAAQRFVATAADRDEALGRVVVRGD